MALGVSFKYLIANKKMKAITYLTKSAGVNQRIKSDGCTFPFGDFFEKHFDWKPACVAHDYGGLGYIDGIRPGLHNDIHFLKANWYLGNYIWGPVAFLAVVPYTVTKHNIGIKKLPILPFYMSLGFITLITLVVNGVV